MRHHRTYILGLVIGVLAVGGCQTPNEKARVHIEYDQVANFYEYRLSPDAFSTTGAGDGMFIQYKITKIINTGSEAMPFVFGKNKILAVVPDKTSNEEPAGDAILLGAMLAHNITVQPGQTVTNPGCIIKHVLTSNPQALDNTGALVNLIHQIKASQPVSMKRLPSDDSTALISNALPSHCQQYCGN